MNAEDASPSSSSPPVVEVSPFTLTRRKPTHVQHAVPSPHTSELDRSSSTTPVKEDESGGRIHDVDDDDGINVNENETSTQSTYIIPSSILLLLAFTSTAQNFTTYAITLFINLELHYGPIDVTRYWIYMGYAAWLQPVVGWMADALIVRGEKRRPIFLLSLSINVLCLLLAMQPCIYTNFLYFVLLSFALQLGNMGLYIPLNGLLVELGRKMNGETDEDGTARIAATMSRAMLWRSAGSLGGAVLQTMLVLLLSVPQLLGVSALLYAVLLPIMLMAPRALFVPQSMEVVSLCGRLPMAMRRVKRSFARDGIRSDGAIFIIILAFIFTYTVMPDSSPIYANYLYTTMTFPTWMFSLINCIGMLGAMLGSFFFSLWMDHRAAQEARGGVRTSIFFIFLIGSIAWALGYVTNLMLCTGFITDTLHINATVFVLVDSFVVACCARFAFMPTFAMAAEHAPKYFEATAFEVFTVASVAGGTLSYIATMHIAEVLHIRRDDYEKLWVLILISIVAKLAIIPLARLLPRKRVDADVVVEHGSTTLDEHDDEEENGDVRDVPSSP